MLPRGSCTKRLRLVGRPAASQELRAEARVELRPQRRECRLSSNRARRNVVLMDEAGHGEITHVWTTMWARGGAPLKALVLRMYWDGESTPSVESPLGDFFGLGLGDYVVYQSAPLAVAPERALNCFFPMPFQKHARITVTNEGAGDVPPFYFTIDFPAFPKPLSADLLSSLPH